MSIRLLFYFTFILFYFIFYFIFYFVLFIYLIRASLPPAPSVVALGRHQCVGVQVRYLCAPQSPSRYVRIHMYPPPPREAWRRMKHRQSKGGGALDLLTS